MKCAEIMPWLDMFRTSETEPGIRQQIQQHLAHCENCSREASFMKDVAQEARRVYRPSRSEVPDRYGAVETELGNVWVAYRCSGITFVQLHMNTAAEFEAAYKQRMRRQPHAAAVPPEYGKLIREAVAGTLRSRPPVDIAALAPFEQRVLQALQTIPAGEVRTYAWLAREADRPAAVRAAGNAMARNPIPLLLPCHRAVPTAGGVGNYAFGAEVKRQLLSREGVPIAELDELARSGIRYVGSRTTQIFCFPTCRAARRIRPLNRVLLSGTSAAVEAGYRACLLCRPV